MAEVATTKEDFELFKTECERWIEIYGLKNWSVYYQHGGIDDNAYGNCQTNLKGRIATIALAAKFPESDYTPDNIKRTAFHEVTELLTARYYTLATDRCVTESEFIDANHELIRILERVLFPKYISVS